MPRIELRPDGPHSNAYTRKVAGAFAESVKVLNHAALTRAGLSNPDTAYTLLGELSAGAHGLRQLCELISAYLAEECTAGRLGSDHGPDAVAGEIATARARLSATAATATALSDFLAGAQSALSALYLKDGS